MSDSSEDDGLFAKERARMALEDAVWRALEAGFTPAEIRKEVGYACENAND